MPDSPKPQRLSPAAKAAKDAFSFTASEQRELRDQAAKIARRHGLGDATPEDFEWAVNKKRHELPYLLLTRSFEPEKKDELPRQQDVRIFMRKVGKKTEVERSEVTHTTKKGAKTVLYRPDGKPAQIVESRLGIPLFVQWDAKAARERARLNMPRLLGWQGAAGGGVEMYRFGFAPGCDPTLPYHAEKPEHRGRWNVHMDSSADGIAQKMTTESLQASLRRAKASWPWGSFISYAAFERRDDENHARQLRESSSGTPSLKTRSTTLAGSAEPLPGEATGGQAPAVPGKPPRRGEEPGS